MKTHSQFGLALALLFPVSLATESQAQGLVGNEVTATLVTDSVEFSSDTTVVVFHSWVDSSSPSPLASLYIGAEGGLAAADPPAGDEAHWLTTTDAFEFQGGVWAALATIQPGSASGPLRFRGAGYPGVVDSWIVGYVDILSLPAEDTIPLPQYAATFQGGSVPGKTVGVVPVPLDASPGGLLDRLATLAAEACGALGWVPDSTTCTSISSDIADADAAEAASDPATADAELAAVLVTLETALSDGNANSLGYWLLRSNIEIIRGKL